jgi:hypothetical protein
MMLLFTAALVGLTALFLIVTNVLAEDQTFNNVIELDGNTSDDPPHGAGFGTGVDWEQVCEDTGGAGNSAIGEQSPLPANVDVATCVGDWVVPDVTYFGSNKDIEDTTDWDCTKINNPTPKNEILNSYAALGEIQGGNHAGDTALYVGFERGKNNGTAFQGVWFLKKPVACQSPATGEASFTGGPHTAWHFDAAGNVLNTCDNDGNLGAGTEPCTGDLLLLINFTGGGSTATTSAFVWAPDHADIKGVLATLDGAANGGPVFNVQGVDCQGATANASTTACATTNNPAFTNNGVAEGCINTPWPPADQASCTTGGKGQNEPVIDSFQFFEGFINLEQIFGSVPCFSQALFEARVSDSPEATLKDYTLGDFDTCGTVIIHKETDPDDADGSFGFTTDLNGSFNLTDDGNNQLGCDYSGDTVSTADDCGTTGTIVFENVPAGSYFVEEDDPTTLDPPFDFTNLTCQVNSGNASFAITDRKVDITMGTLGVVECLYENTQRGSIIVRKEDGNGNDLAGAGFTFDVNPFTGVAGDIEIDDGSTDDQANGDDGILCIDNVIFGTYNITETDVPDGYFGDTDTESVTVSSPSSCADRLAGTFTPDATFTNLLGSIIIRKEAKNLNTVATDDLLAGATFDISPNPLTGDATPLSITDGDGNDQFATGGLICIDGVRNLNGGSYSVTEDPDSFEFYVEDTDTETVTVSSASTCADRTESDAEDALFQNDPLSEIRVIFTSLAGSGVTGATIDCAPQGGSNLTPTVPDTDPLAFNDLDETYTDLLEGTYICTIVIDP